MIHRLPLRSSLQVVRTMPVDHVLTRYQQRSNTADRTQEWTLRYRNWTNQCAGGKVHWETLLSDHNLVSSLKLYILHRKEKKKLKVYLWWSNLELRCKAVSKVATELLRNDLTFEKTGLISILQTVRWEDQYHSDFCNVIYQATGVGSVNNLPAR